MKKRYLFLLLVVIIFAITMSLPAFIENKWEASLQLDSWRKAITQQILKDTKLQFNVQGVYLDLWQGVVLKGVSLQDEKRSCCLHAENAIIKFSPLSLFSEQLKFDSIHAKAAKLRLAAYNSKTLKECRQGLLSFYQNSKNDTISLQLPIFLSNVQVSIIKKKVQDFQGSLIAHISFWPEVQELAKTSEIETETKKNTIARKQETKLNLIIRSAFSKDKNRHIEIETIGKNLSYIQFHAAPFKLLNLFLYYYDWQDETIITYLEKVFQPIQNTGKLDGKGRIVSSKKQKELQLAIQYKDVVENSNPTFLPLSWQQWFNLHNTTGDLKLQAIFHNTEKTKRTRADRKRSKSGILDFYLEIKQPDLKLKFTKKNLLTNRKANAAVQVIYTLTGNASFSEERFTLPIAIQSGQVTFDLQFHKQDKTIRSKGKLLGKNIVFPTMTYNDLSTDSLLKENELQNPKPSYDYTHADTFMGNIRQMIADLQEKLRVQRQEAMEDISQDHIKTKHNTKAVNLVLDDFSFRKNSYSDKANIIGIGHWFGTKFNIEGNGEFALISTANDIYLKPKLDLQVNLSHLTLNSILYTIHRIYKLVYRESNKTYIRKVRQDEFVNSRLYRFLLANLQLKLQLALTNIQTVHPIPKNLQLQAKANPQYFEIELTDPEVNDDFYTDFRFAIYFQSNMPRHDIDFSLYLNNNKNSFYLLTGTKTPPEKIDISYRYDGYGISFTDLLHDSYSLLRLNAKNLLLANQKLVKTMTYAKGFVQKEIAVDSLTLSRGCKGIHAQFYFDGRSPEIRVLGNGKYDVGVGGQTDYTIYIQREDEKKTRSRHSLQILPSGKWIPNI